MPIVFMEDADQIHNFRIARWLERLVAYLIDSLITGVIIGTIFFSVLAILLASSARPTRTYLA